MTVTILASLFIAFILFIAAVGFKLVIKQGKAPEDLNTEKCSLCGDKFNKSMLIERQVGDYRIYFFCPSCVNKLYNEMVSKN